MRLRSSQSGDMPAAAKDAEAFPILNERPQDAVQVESLHDRVFGPGRFTKVSERVREFAVFAPDYSFCAWDGERLLGAVRQWRVRVGETPVVFLGPLAVDPDRRSVGLGARLVERACAAARAGGERAVLLVGDASYFGGLGFSADAAAGIVMPRPVDPARVLLRTLAGGGPIAGAVRAP